MYRQLGFFETSCKYAHDLFCGTSNVIVRVNLEGDLNLELIKEALYCLFLRHPLLRATIAEIQSSLFFSCTADFNHIPILILDRQWDNHFEKVVLTEMQQRFIIQKYLWRFTILYSVTVPKHEFIIAFHHAIADGLATVNFVDELLKTYLQLFSNKKNVIHSLPLMPSIETILSKNNDWNLYLNEKNKIYNETIELWHFYESKPIKERTMHNIYSSLESFQLFNLEQLCHKEKTTIHALLCACLLLALYRLKNNFNNTTLHTPVNLRNYCNPIIDKQYFGCHIAIVTTVHQVLNQEKNIWHLAREYKAQLIENISKIGFYPNDFNLDEFSISELMQLFDMPSSKKNHFNGGFGVTNIGKIGLLKNYGSLILKDFMFCTNHVMGEYISFLHVLTVHNKLSFCFSYAYPLLSHHFAEALSNEFMKILINTSEIL